LIRSGCEIPGEKQASGADEKLAAGALPSEQAVRRLRIHKRKLPMTRSFHKPERRSHFGNSLASLDHVEPKCGHAASLPCTRPLWLDARFGSHSCCACLAGSRAASGHSGRAGCLLSMGTLALPAHRRARLHAQHTRSNRRQRIGGCGARSAEWCASVREGIDDFVDQERPFVGTLAQAVLGPASPIRVVGQHVD